MNNKLINELACQTLTRFDQDMDGSMEPWKLGDWIRYDDLEKFAELIIQECIDQVGHFQYGPDGEQGEFAMDVLRSHFGVEC